MGEPMKKQESLKETILRNVGGLFLLAGIATLLPYSNATYECMLGYRAICGFAPFSTIVCFIAAAAAYGVKDKTVSQN
jgi:hypothetical protein